MNAAVGPLSVQQVKCKAFNVEEWEKGQGILLRDGNLWSVATSAPNGLLRYKKHVSLDQDVKITFVPHSETQVNFVATMHDLYEVDVGDGNFKRITLKVTQGADRPMKLMAYTNGRFSNSFDGIGMEPGSDVTLVLSQGVSRLGDGSYLLNLQLARNSYETKTPSDVLATYSFALPPNFSYIGDDARFSIGLKAASDHSKVAAEFLCVELF